MKPISIYFKFEKCFIINKCDVRDFVTTQIKGGVLCEKQFI